MLWRSIHLFPLALTKTLLDYVQLITGVSLFARRRDHFTPHPSAGFEGYYTRTQLDDGGTLAIIFCCVRGAKTRENLVCVMYQPGSNSILPPFKHEFYPDRIDTTVHPLARPEYDRAFKLSAEDIGTMEATSTSIHYTISVPQLEFHVDLRLTKDTPWSYERPFDGPMGPLLHLSDFLPLNWHVRSTASNAEYSITRAGQTQRGKGIAHVEKNWGRSFPSGWIWSQASGPMGSTFCLAGGDALYGVQSYLIGYRSPRFQWDFRPPFTFAIGRFSPCMRVEHNSVSGTFNMESKTFTRKLAVSIAASPDSFIGLSAPLQEGHRPAFAFESFEASISIILWERQWPWQDWRLVETVWKETSCAALEFGGDFSHRTRVGCEE